MYAVIESGGKQHRVSEGDLIKVEKLEGDLGSKLQLKALFIGGVEGTAAKLGAPEVAGATVEAEIVSLGKHRKVIHFRKKKEGWTKKRGHRQMYTELKILSVQA